MPNEIKAFVIAVAVFTVLQFILIVVSNNVVNTAADVENIVPWINATAYFLYVITGFVVGVIAKRRIIVNGVIGGVLAAAAAAVLFGVGRDLFGIAALLTYGGVLGGIGGACFLLSTRLRTSVE